MVDEFIHWPNPYLLLWAACDEKLSWMIEIWMKYHLVSDSNCNIVILQSPRIYYKEWQIMLGYQIMLLTLYISLQWVLSNTIRIGDTKYHN